PGRRAGESGENGQPAAAFLSVQLVDGRRSRSVGEGRSSAASAAHSRQVGEGIDSPGKRGRGAYGRVAGDHGSLAGQPQRGAPGARTACPLGSSSLFHFKAWLRGSDIVARSPAETRLQRARLPSQFGKAWSILEKLLAPGSPLSSIIPHN